MSIFDVLRFRDPVRKEYKRVEGALNSRSIRPPAAVAALQDAKQRIDSGHKDTDAIKELVKFAEKVVIIARF